MNKIPTLFLELALQRGKVVIKHFLDNNQGAAEMFKDMLDLIHHQYFPQLAWARLTLNPKKMKFFMTTIGILGHECQPGGLHLSVNKLAAL